LLDELQAKGLISEAARGRVGGAPALAANGRLARIRAGAARARGWRSDLIDASLERVRAGEFDRARQVLARRFGAAPATEAERARRARFLISRGFAADVVRRAIDASEDVEDGF
jgi:regulatory protein